MQAGSAPQCNNLSCSTCQWCSDKSIQKSNICIKNGILYLIYCNLNSEKNTYTKAQFDNILMSLHLATITRQLYYGFSTSLLLTPVCVIGFSGCCCFSHTNVEKNGFPIRDQRPVPCFKCCCLNTVKFVECLMEWELISNSRVHLTWFFWVWEDWKC